MMVLAGLLLVLVAILGVVLVFRFVESERQREVQDWQIRLGIVADTRAAAVNEWIEEQFTTLRELAENASLQLYVTEISLLGGQTDEEDELGEAGYLRNLLVATADRGGFTAPFTGPEVNANVERVGLAGLALTDPAGKVLVATPGTPPLQGRIVGLMAELARGERGLLDIHRGASGQPTIGFVFPVFGVQADAGASRVIGQVVGIRVLDDSLFGLLAQPGETSQSAETFLARLNGPNVEFLSPLADGTAPLRRVLARDTPGLASAFVLEQAGGFGRKTDYANADVLVTGRKIAAAPWVLVRKINAAEALASTETRLKTMLIVFILIIVITTAVIFAVWRHGSSLRATAAAERYRVSSERYQNLGKFLRVVTDSQPTEMISVTEDGIYTFANKRAADGAGISAEDMVGKSLSSVIGPVRAKAYQEINKPILREVEDFLRRGEPLTKLHNFDDDRGTHIVRSTHFPLRGDRDHEPAVLMILDDITELMQERERRESVFRALVKTLVDLVGQRDPYSANHATRVAEVSCAIAREMDVSNDDIRTIEIAAQLMNLGKTLVPVEILTSPDRLTPEERQLVSDSILTSANLLDGVDFDGPVAETIRQVQERWDGSGRPRGLVGEDIMLGARIVAAANAFVAMVSQRAYRHRPASFDEALNMLFGDSGIAFDRRVVSALMNAVDNRGARELWARYREAPEAAA
jgi:PAS domain S-box-containing protein